MTSSLGGSIRRCRELTDIVPQYDDSLTDRSQVSTGSGESDQKSIVGSIRITHLTNCGGLGLSRFPKLEECAHFHYEHVELGSLQVSLYEEEDLKSLSSLEYNENTENKWLTVKVTSQGQNWLLRRTYENFRMLDQQLHQCIYDRKFSTLPELPPLENLPEKQDPQAYIKCHLNKYCERFSDIAGSLINCGPVLSWLQLDNRGRRILVTDGDSCPINTPAVAAAYAIKKYTAVAADEISFDVGDMISVIDMPPPEDSIWWRGKRGFMVGFFPSYCVAVITDKVPRNLHLNQPSSIIEPTKPVLRKHGKLIAFFRAFILSRPSKRHLKQSGIFKERVFGCDLGEHLLNSGRDVPMVLKCCSKFIELHGIVDGIYRLSGATSNIQKLRTTFDEDRIPALYNDDSILQDIHSVASLLKMYFRELPNPLCTYQLYKNFVNAVQNADPADRVTSMREAVQKLPPPHFRTLEFLMRHLSRVAEHGNRTGMTARNIAIVWAPNLLRCKELEYGGVAALQGVGVQAVVTEFLISNVDLVFCSEQQISFQGTSKKIRPKSLSLGTPTKLLSLEEAQSKRLGSEHSHDNYIEVGGGPACLPKMYHTVIELPVRKRIPLKRSPIGWKSFFSRSGSGSPGLRKSASTNSGKRKPSNSNAISYKHVESLKKSESDIKTRLRTVKSAESLISGLGNTASARNSVCLDFLSPPSPKLSITGGHSRSVSHDSYFDHLAESTPVHSIHRDEEGLSELHVNFDLDESEMKIFSEESSQLFSTSSSEHLQPTIKRIPLLASAENTIIVDPSPKKHKTSDSSSCSSTTLSDDMTAVSNKRSRLEEQLLDSDFAYIDSQYNDRLVVEVDVHHRQTSQISSPMTDTIYSENETVLSSCTTSDTTITNNNVAYTPLSECSCTSSSNYDPSYQQLSSSLSSNQLPKNSSDPKIYEYKQYENLTRNRYSYQGELRPNVYPGNRRSLQTLSTTTEHDHRLGNNTFSLNSSTDIPIDRASTITDVPSQYEKSCDNYNHSKEAFSDIHVDENNRKLETVDEMKCSDRLECKSEYETNSSPPLPTEYGNIQKLELILNDKDMFSDGEEKFRVNVTLNDSPYDLITLVGNRMTSVSNESMILENNKNNLINESNYEEIQPMCSSDSNKDCNYEEVNAVYSDNDAYNYEKNLMVNEKAKLRYEEISLLGVNFSAVKDGMSSSNESLESSTDEAMIENNLYESLVAEDSSPDGGGSNRSSKVVENGMSNLQQRKVINNYKNIVITLEAAKTDVNREMYTEHNPLLISENSSPCSDIDPIYYDNRNQLNNVQSKEELSRKHEDIKYSDYCNNDDDKNSHSIIQVKSLDTNIAAISDRLTLKDQNSNDNCNNANNFIDCSAGENEEDNVENIKMENNLLRSSYTKSVQDLVSKFEWSAENDYSSVKKELCMNSKYENSLSDNHDTLKCDRAVPEKRDNCSLAQVSIKRPSQEAPINSMETFSEEKEDESVRRDRIEKYKEERRIALRQKYQVGDDMNDKKDEEMIKRFKQKIFKNDKNEYKNCCESNSSPNDINISTESEEYLMNKENKSAAVTTISILYTSKKRRECSEIDKNETQRCLLSELKDLEKYDKKYSFRGNIQNTKAVDSKSLSIVGNDWMPKQNTNCNERRSCTSSLERKFKNNIKEESLVAKRVNQLSEASESFDISRSRRSGEFGSVRQRAHSTSGPVVPYCIRDIAAIFENKDNNK